MTHQRCHRPHLTSTTLRHLSITTAPQSSEMVVGLFAVGLERRASHRSQVSCVGNFDSSRWFHDGRRFHASDGRTACRGLRETHMGNIWTKKCSMSPFNDHLQLYWCIYFVVWLPPSWRPVVLSEERMENRHFQFTLFSCCF